MCNNAIIKTSNKDEMTYTYSTKYSEFRREVSQSANMNPRAWQTSCAESQFKLQTVPFILIWLSLLRRVTNRNPSSSVSVNVPFTSLTSETLSRYQVGSEEYIDKDIFNNVVRDIKQVKIEFSLTAIDLFLFSCFTDSHLHEHDVNDRIMVTTLHG